MMWKVFSMYSYRQIKWVLLEKPAARDAYVRGVLNERLEEVYESVEETFEEFAKDYVVIME